jgi:3-oxo-5-alpha-steroid 4-dehydrogenase 1
VPYRAILALEFALAAATFVALRFVTAPYGRHERAGWGPTIPARAGWLVMESPAALLFLAFWLAGDRHGPLALVAMWELHYGYRAFVYPFRTRPTARMPVLVTALAIAFNVLNAYLNATWVSTIGRYGRGWLTDPRFLAGATLFGAGLALNVASDRTLRGLRRPGERGYRIPYGGAFRFVSSPNYLGEIVEWTGWALAAWSPAGLAFTTYTVANLAPRAADHHRWYRERFPDYPPGRRALIPYVW